MKKKCPFGERYLLAYYLGEISGDIAAQIEVHLRTCSSCQQDLAILQAILATSEKIKKEIELELEKVDWKGLPIAIEKKIQEAVSRPRQIAWPWSPLFQGLSFINRSVLRHIQIIRPWVFLLRWSTLAGLIIGLFLGFISYHYLLRPEKKWTQAELMYQVPGPFLERVDEEMARKEVLDYLEKSRLILISMKQAVEVSPEVIPLPPEKLRNLLWRKKYFSPQLDSFSLAKAKQILEEIDAFLLELALTEEKISSDEARHLVRLIDEKQLLLKIQLLLQELKEGEGIT